jgi:hypothetical protein
VCAWVLCVVADWQRVERVAHWPVECRSMSGIAVDLPGNRIIYGDREYCSVHAVDMKSGAVTALVGTSPGSVRPPTPAPQQLFDQLPYASAIAIDPMDGALYVGGERNIVRVDEKRGVCAVVAGLFDSAHHLSDAKSCADGVGSAARFGLIHSMACDSNGTLYVGDYHNGNVRRCTRVPCDKTPGGLCGPLPSALRALARWP